MNLAKPNNHTRVKSVLYGIKWLLFYPASGLRERTSGALANTDSYGYAWSSAVTGANGYNVYFGSTDVYPLGGNNRARGYSVRCVQHLQQTFRSELRKLRLS
jgi:hypothetical protein